MFIHALKKVIFEGAFHMEAATLVEFQRSGIDGGYAGGDFPHISLPPELICRGKEFSAYALSGALRQNSDPHQRTQAPFQCG